MTSAHWAVVLAVATGIGLQLAGLEHWGDAVNPKFVSGLILNVAGAVAALFTKQVNRDPTIRERVADIGGERRQ